MTSVSAERSEGQRYAGVGSESAASHWKPNGWWIGKILSAVSISDSD